MNLKKFIISLTIVGILLFSAVGAGTILLNEKNDSTVLKSVQKISDFSSVKDGSDPSMLSTKTVTLIDEGFEDGIPDTYSGWTNTGWLFDYYGSPCEGDSWAYSWAAGDELTTPALDFGFATTISFQNKAETNPMDLEVWIDHGTSSEELIWSESDYTHTCENNIINLDDGYEGMHTVTWLGQTSDFYGQILDDILITTEVDNETIHIDVTKSVAEGSDIDFYEFISIQDDSYPTFKIIIENNGMILDDLSVRDELPQGFYFDENVTIPTDLDSFSINEDENVIWWNFTDVPTDWSATIIFSAALDDSDDWCGDNTNHVFVTGSTDSSSKTVGDTAFVHVQCGLPDIEVEKTVRLEGDSDWSEYVLADPGDIVEFNVIIHNPYDNYTIHWSGDIIDTFPCNLEYVNGSMDDFPLHEQHNGEEVVDWRNKTVLWHPTNDQTVQAGEYLNFTYEAVVTCDCGTMVGYNNVTVSPDYLESDDHTIPNSDRGHDGGIPLNVSDSAEVGVICEGDQPGVSVVKYSADDCHNNWNDSVATDVHVSSYPKFKIDVSNSGDVMLDTITVVDTLPVGFSFDDMVSGHDDPIVDGRQLTWTFENKAVDWSDSLIFTVSFDEESIVCQEYENEVDVTGETCGYGIVFDSDSAWVNIVGCEQEPGEEILTIEKWVKPNCHDDLWEKSISFNYSDYEYVTYRVDIHVNDSFSEPIFDLQIRDNLPQLNGLRYNESYMRRIIGENEEEPYYNYDMEIMDDFIYWQFNDEIYPGSTFSLYYCADVIACGTFENWVNVTGFYYDGGPCCPVDVFVNDSATVDVICGSGIDVTKEASLDGETWSSDGVNSYLDDTIWFRLTVKNIGFETLEGVNVHDYLPDFLEFNEMIDDGDADHVFTDCENETWDLRWFFTELAIGEEVQIIFTADVTKVKNGTNVVTVSSCGGPGSSDSVDIVVDEGMFVEKKASLNGEDWSENITVSSGETVSWKVTIDYLNSNNSCILHHLTLWDILPEELTYVDDSAVVKLHDGTSYFMNPEIDDDVLIWDLDDEFLLNGGWIKVTFDTLVDSDAFGEIENEVNVTGRVCDGKYYEVTDSAIAYVSSGNLASCEKLVRRNSGDAWVDEIDANLDEEISFKITLTNTGFGAMNHINIEDDLPDELEYIQDSSELYFDGEIVSCEPLLVGETLVWEDICTCIPNENSEEEARYLLVDETVSITFDVRTLSSGTAINQMSIDAKMCENAVQVSCSDDATVNIELDPLIADAGNSYSGYVNDEIQFLGSATGGIPDYSYNWDLDDDDEFDDSTLQNPTQTWTEAGSYTVSLKVVDDSGSNDTDSATVIIEDREPNLYCSGSITLTDIEPGSTQTATITVENTGDPGSKLDWSILDEPTWGEWTFSPSDGNDLTPEEGDQTIDVTIVVPDEKNEEFSGTITFVNDDDSSDTCDVTVSVATPHNNQHPFLRLLNNLIERFPFLDWLVETFSS